MRLHLHSARSVRGITLLGLIVVLAIVLIVGLIIYVVWWLADTALGKADDGTVPVAVSYVPRAQVLYQGPCLEAAEDAILGHIEHVGGVPDKSPHWALQHSTNMVDWDVIRIIDPNTLPEGTYFEIQPLELIEEHPWMRDIPQGFFKLTPSP